MKQRVALKQCDFLSSAPLRLANFSYKKVLCIVTPTKRFYWGHYIGGLLKFSEEAENLAAAWFGNKEYNEITQEMEDYILQGGVYGTLKQNLAMSQNKKGGKFRHLMSRIFLSYKDMAVYYPSLKKCPILFPFYQVRRWCRILFCGGRKAAMNEIKVNKNITTEEQERAKKLLEELNL